VIAWDNGRCVFEPPLGPGETRLLNVGVIAPLQSGKHQLELDIGWEGVTWFKDRGSETATVDLTVS
jgi:hypothetical protein